ncbi:hypothetical protein PMIN04_012630 [Paraphaeosphaeria minitans]
MTTTPEISQYNLYTREPYDFKLTERCSEEKSTVRAKLFQNYASNRYANHQFSPNINLSSSHSNPPPPHSYNEQPPGRTAPYVWKTNTTADVRYPESIHAPAQLAVAQSAVTLATDAPPHFTATASSTPIGSYSSLGCMHSQSNVWLRKDSLLSLLGQSQGFSANAPMMQNIDIGDSSDDEIPQPMKLSALTTALLAQNEANSPERIWKPKVRVSRSGSGTPVLNTVTPAPSWRIKRVPLRGAPMRWSRRTPQSEDERHPPSQDQENLVPMSVVKPDSKNGRRLSHEGPGLDHEDSRPRHATTATALSPIQRQERLVPLPSISANTPRRPAPPPPPRTSALETVTVTAGAATTKTRKRNKRSIVTVHNRHYQLMERIGKGGSSVVLRGMAENYKLLALKRVKLDAADEAAVMGYKGTTECGVMACLRNRASLSNCSMLLK